ncbi:MAG: hypothetical protein ACPL3P_09595, partial [Anaerolineales bacterium]
MKKLPQQRLAFYLLALIFIINFSILFLSNAKDLMRLLHMGYQDVLWREVAFHDGDKAANFIRFLNANIPQTAEVIYPTFEINQPPEIFST